MLRKDIKSLCRLRFEKKNKANGTKKPEAESGYFIYPALAGLLNAFRLTKE